MASSSITRLANFFFLLQFNILIYIFYQRYLEEPHTNFLLSNICHSLMNYDVRAFQILVIYCNVLLPILSYWRQGSIWNIFGQEYFRLLLPPSSLNCELATYSYSALYYTVKDHIYTTIIYNVIFNCTNRNARSHDLRKLSLNNFNRNAKDISNTGKQKLGMGVYEYN